MGIESPVHLLFVAVVALLVLGPKRLPGLARALGQGIREFRQSLDLGAQDGHGVREPGDRGSLGDKPPPVSQPVQDDDRSGPGD